MALNVSEISPIRIVDISPQHADYYARGKGIALEQGGGLTDTDFDLYRQAWQSAETLSSGEDPSAKVKRLKTTYLSANEEVRHLITDTVVGACRDLIKTSRRRSLVPVTVGSKVVFQRTR